MKVLLSCFACAPDKGSEPGVGWNWAVEAARVAEVWVLTRTDNRPAIETELAHNPTPNLHVIYHDLPLWARFWRRGSRGIHLYYYLWQLSAIPKMRRLHQAIGFDLAHHVTYVTFRFPSALAFLGIPYVWGPVAGGDRIPWPFYRALGLSGAITEVVREIHNRLAQLDPFVRVTARRASAVLTATEATRRALPGPIQQKCRVVPAIGIDREEFGSPTHSHETDELRLIFVGSLVPLKGVRFALEALARLDPSRGRISLTVVGDGPERPRLETLATKLGINDRVKFIGGRSRSEVLRIYRDHHVLVFPSLRDSGGFAVLEAMATGLPVICLALGGPAITVIDRTGICIPAITPCQVVRDLARAIANLHDNPDLRHRTGEAARQRAVTEFNWERKGEFLRQLYAEVGS